MYILEKYLLLLILYCAPIVHPFKSETTGQGVELLNKDSISEFEELTLQPEGSTPFETLEIMWGGSLDSSIVNTTQWKFRKHMILGN